MYKILQNSQLQFKMNYTKLPLKKLDPINNIPCFTEVEWSVMGP